MSIDIRCPHCGQHSTDPEYCSECGKPVAVAAAEVVPASPASNNPADPGGSATMTHCRDCGEPRPGPNARFCDNCRFDFFTGASFNPAPAAVVPPAVLAPDPVMPAPVAVPATVASTSLPSVAPVVSLATAALRWELLAVTEATSRQGSDPAALVSEPDRVFPLFEENLIGRRSESRSIFPEVPLDADAGVSRRHAQLSRQPDGSLSILDLGSTNGTQLNGTDIVPHVPTPLADGDVITLGDRTRLTLRSRS